MSVGVTPALSQLFSMLNLCKLLRLGKALGRAQRPVALSKAWPRIATRGLGARSAVGLRNGIRSGNNRDDPGPGPAHTNNND
jgi:hypothetical protein